MLIKEFKMRLTLALLKKKSPPGHIWTGYVGLHTNVDFDFVYIDYSPPDY